MEGAKLLQKGIKWRLGNGKRIKFWLDYWITREPLIKNIWTELPQDKVHKVVSDYWTGTGWDWRSLGNYLQQDHLEAIRAVQVYGGAGNEDRLSWELTTNGDFTMAFAYEVDGEHDASEQIDTNWDKLWKLRGPSRWQFLLWVVRHKKLLTNSDKQARHLHATGLCDLCKARQETTLHALRDCRWISDVWRKLVHHLHWQTFNTK